MEGTILNGDWTIYIKDILHLVSQALLIPVTIVLLALMVYAVFSLGSLAIEYVTERRRFTVKVPDFIDQINDAKPQQLAEVIEKSGLLSDQKLVLITVARSIGLPKEDLFALAKAELTGEREMYDKVVTRNDMVVKMAPIFGLLATLIPLGPGVVAMGQGDVNQLATSLLIAFDGTVAGLISAAVFMLIWRFRKRWYARYMLALETGMRCLLQKAELSTQADLEAIGYSASLADTRLKSAQSRAVGTRFQKKPQATSKLTTGEETLGTLQTSGQTEGIPPLTKGE